MNNPIYCENCIFFYENILERTNQCLRFPPKENYKKVNVCHRSWCGEFIDRDTLLPFITCIKLNRSNE